MRAVAGLAEHHHAGVTDAVQEHLHGVDDQLSTRHWGAPRLTAIVSDGRYAYAAR